MNPSRVTPICSTTGRIVTPFAASRFDCRSRRISSMSSRSWRRRLCTGRSPEVHRKRRGGVREQMTSTKPKSVTFETTVAASGNNTGIVVPEDAIAELAAGKRPPVLVNVNGHEYRNTVGVMNGKYMISISAAMRKATGLKAADPITVTLTVAESPREVDIPDDFRTALAAN